MDEMTQNNNLPYEDQIDLVDFFHKLQKYKKIIFLTTFIFTITALVYSFQRPQIYQTTLLLEGSFFEYSTGFKVRVEPIDETIPNLKIHMLHKHSSHSKENKNIKITNLENELVKIEYMSDSVDKNLAKMNQIIEYLSKRQELIAISILNEEEEKYTGTIESMDRQIEFTRIKDSNMITKLKNQYKLLENSSVDTSTALSKLEITKALNSLENSITSLENSTKIFDLIEAKALLEKKHSDVKNTKILLPKIYDEIVTVPLKMNIALITVIGFLGGLLASLIIIFIKELNFNLKSN